MIGERLPVIAGDASTGIDTVTGLELGTDVFQIAGTGMATVAYDNGANQITVSIGTGVLAVLNSAGDLSGFGVDDIVFV